jgi:hypothetical protein
VVQFSRHKKGHKKGHRPQRDFPLYSQTSGRWAKQVLGMNRNNERRLKRKFPAGFSVRAGELESFETVFDKLAGMLSLDRCQPTRARTTRTNDDEPIPSALDHLAFVNHRSS